MIEEKRIFEQKWQEKKAKIDANFESNEKDLQAFEKLSIHHQQLMPDSLLWVVDLLATNEMASLASTEQMMLEALAGRKVGLLVA